MKKIPQLFFIILISFTTIQHGYTARILAGIPTASYSHQVFFQMLWRELALRGHEVVVLTTDPTHENLTNFQEIDMSSTYQMMEGSVKEVIKVNDDKMAVMKKFGELYYQMSEYQLGLPQVQSLIKDETQHFDLVMLEYLYPSFYAFKHRFNCPFIGVTSLDGTSAAHEVMGNPVQSVLYPYSLLGLSGEMSFQERLFSFYISQMRVLTSGKLVSAMNHLNRKYFGDDYPDLTELASSVDMLFINGNPMFADIRPITPGTINIAGGMHMKPPKPLPEDLKEFLDESKQGVIYFSMGSNVKSKNLDNSTLKTIMETFAQVPYNVLWKFEADDLPGRPENVKIIKWAPQQDVLRHKNIKLFITQAGMQSLEEALFTHIPLIVMPFLGDQDSNAGRVANKELGIRLDHKALNVEEFKSAIIEVITNPKYKDNITKLARQIQDQPMTPLDRAVWWTEYVLRHKSGQHLKGAKIPTYQYYYLDVLAFLGACLLLVSLGIYFLCRFLYRFAVGLSQRVTIKIKKA